MKQGFRKIEVNFSKLAKSPQIHAIGISFFILPCTRILVI